MNVEKNWLEWTVFGASAVLIAAVLGYLIYDSINDETPEADLTVELGEVVQRDAVYLVPVRVRNEGSRSAEGVLVEVTLVDGGQEIETAEFEIDYAPRHSSREGWVAFTIDPSTATLEARVLGYQEP